MKEPNTYVPIDVVRDEYFPTVLLSNVFQEIKDEVREDFDPHIADGDASAADALASINSIVSFIASVIPNFERQMVSEDEAQTVRDALRTLVSMLDHTTTVSAFLPEKLAQAN